MPIQQPNQSEQELLAYSIAQAMSDTNNLQKYRTYCRKYPRAVIERAFQVSRTIPKAQLKKSRAAVFFYLAKQYAHHQISQNSGD